MYDYRLKYFWELNPEHYRGKEKPAWLVYIPKDYNKILAPLTEIETENPGTRFHLATKDGQRLSTFGDGGKNYSNLVKYVSEGIEKRETLAVAEMIKNIQ